MKINRYDEVKVKVVGGSMEVFGDLIDDEEMEYKGKLKKTKGKVREVSNDVLYELEDVKDKVVGSAKEVTGKVLDDEEMELKGKIQKGIGKAREMAGDVVGEVEDVKDKVLGSVRETTGNLSWTMAFSFSGKMQKSKATSPYTNKIIGGLGVLLGLSALKRLFTRKK